MRPVARLGEVELGPLGDDLLAEIDEADEHVAQRQLLRAPAVERQHVDGERLLKLRVAVKLIQHHIRGRVAAKLDDDADAVTV